MSKESNKIISAWSAGNSDKLDKKPYNNPYDKNREKSKYKAYKNGYKS